jgi:hypothetical protein
MTINGETHGRLESNKVRKVVREEKRRVGAVSKATEE